MKNLNIFTHFPTFVWKNRVRVLFQNPTIDYDEKTFSIPEMCTSLLFQSVFCNRGCVMQNSCLACYVSPKAPFPLHAAR